MGVSRVEARHGNTQRNARPIFEAWFPLVETGSVPGLKRSQRGDLTIPFNTTTGKSSYIYLDFPRAKSLRRGCEICSFGKLSIPTDRPVMNMMLNSPKNANSHRFIVHVTTYRQPVEVEEQWVGRHYKI